MQATGRCRLPPSPAAWPVIGNLHLFGKGGLIIHHTLVRPEHGPLIMTFVEAWSADCRRGDEREDGTGDAQDSEPELLLFMAQLPRILVGGPCVKFSR